LNALPDNSFSFHNTSQKASLPNRLGSPIIQVTNQRIISNPSLISYLQERCIDLEIADRYCSEVEFELFGKRQTAIGFQNDLGGYELRNGDFKGSSSPKSSTIITNQTDRLSVFEGFFDFLSFQTSQKLTFNKHLGQTKNQGSFLILNSLAYLEKRRNQMEMYSRIHLYLDRDAPGRSSTKKALAWSIRYIDKSHPYRHFKDLSEYLCNRSGDNLRQNWGRHL
jgi:hypothetical protein